MSIARKLFLGFLTTILLTAIVAGLGVYHVGGLKQATEFAEQGRRNGLRLREIQIDLLTQVAAARRFLTQRDPDALASFRHQGSLVRLGMIYLARDTLAEDDSEQVARLKHQHELFNARWSAILEKVQQTPPSADELRRRITELTSESRALTTMTEAVIDWYEDRVRAVLRSAEFDARAAHAYLWFDAALAVGLVAFIAVAVTRAIIVPVRELSALTEQVAQGRLDARAKVKSGDELGQLAQAFNNMLDELQRSRAQVQEYSLELERKVAERTAELRQSQERYHSLMENAGDAIFILHPETGACLEANRNACALTGYSREELLGMTSADIMAGPRPQSPPAAGALAGQTLRRKDGSIAIVDIRTTEVEYGDQRVLCSIVRDVTQQHELERQMIQADKMASLGQMAGGVAHELNNPLASILMNVNLAREALPADSEAQTELARVEEDALRCKRIIENLLDFSRQSKMTQQRVDVNDIVQRTIALLQHEADLRGVTIECAPGDPPPAIMADPIQIQQVLVNLVLNALHASPPGAAVRITARQDAGWAEISVQDQGPGIPPADRPKVFDPFFTTKETGTGLGLSICYGIIEKHRGSIHFSTRTEAEAGPGESPGATFIVRLPAAEAEAAEA